MGDVKFGMYGVFYPLETIYETALWAEQCGLDSYWLGDRIVGFPSPPVIDAWLALAAVAVKTRTIKLGVAVTDPFRRNPAVLAQAVVTLDHTAAGRAIPGLGAGEAVNLLPFGIPMERGAERMEELIAVMKQYWTGEPVTFQGKFFQIANGVVQPTPIQRPHPPVWIAANSPKSLLITGRVGDGWLPAAKSPEMYRQDLATVRAEARRAGRDPDAITPGLFAYTVVNDDAEYARQVVKDFGGAILVWWRNSLKRLGISAGSRDLSIVNFDGTPDKMAKWFEAGRDVPVEVAEQLIAFGTPEQVAKRFRDFVDAGVEHFVIVSLDGLGDPARWKETATLLQRRIIPQLRGATA